MSLQPLPDARSSYVTATDGTRLSVKEYGSTDNPTVVLVHGWPDNAEVWDGVVAQLADRYHVVNYDPRGSGPSDHPENVADYRLPQLSLDFESVIDATAPGQKVHVLAHDWGAIMTWESVHRLPDRILSFTFVSGPSLDFGKMALIGSAKNPRRLPALLYQTLASTYIAFNYLPVLPELFWKSGLGPKAIDFLVRLTEGVQRYPFDGIDGAAQTNLYRANIFQRLLNPTYDHVDVPVQQIVPSKDYFVTPVFYEGLEDALHSTFWRRSVDGGHWVVLSNPQAIAAATAEFVEHFENGADAPAGVTVKP